MTESKVAAWRAPKRTRAQGRIWWILGVATAPAWFGCEPAEFGLGSNDTPANLRNKEDSDARAPEAGTQPAPSALASEDTSEDPSSPSEPQAEAGAPEVNEPEANEPEVNEPDPAEVETSAPNTAASPSVEAPAKQDASVDAPTDNAAIETEFAFDAGPQSGRDAGAASGGVTLTDLPGCTREPIDHPPFVEPGFCERYFNCPEGSFSATCSPDGEQWTCSRLGSYVFEDHGVTPKVIVSNAQTADDACNAASLVLQPGRRELYAPDGECEIITDCQENGRYCFERTLCGSGVRLDSGIEVRPDEVASTSCSNVDGTTGCSCSGYGPNDNTFDVSPGSAAVLRDEVADFCRSPEPAVPTGATTCETRSSSVAADFCADDRVCSTEYQTSEGTPLQAIHQWYITCQAGECWCLRDNDGVRVEVEGALEPSEQCAQAVRICDPDQELLFADDPHDCRVREGGDEPTDFVCHELLDCDVSATLGDLDVTSERTFPVDCDLSVEPPVCLCLTPDREVLGELTVEPGDGDPCGTASAYCSDVIEMNP